MATAARNYRKTGRLPRATTKLSTFMNGMFYTEQIVPDGYAKTLINYDIDYTGNCLKPKMGRIQYDDIDNEYYKWLNLTYQANVNVFDKPIEPGLSYGSGAYTYTDPITQESVSVTDTQIKFRFKHEDSHGKADVWLDPNYGLGLAKNDNYIKSDNATHGAIDNKFRTIYNGSVTYDGDLNCHCTLHIISNEGSSADAYGYIYEDNATIHGITLSYFKDMPEDPYKIDIAINDPSAPNTNDLDIQFYELIDGYLKEVTGCIISNVPNTGSERRADVSPSSLNPGTDYIVYINIWNNQHQDIPLLTYNINSDPTKTLNLQPVTLVDNTDIESHRPGVKSVQLNNNIYTFNKNGITMKSGHELLETRNGTTTTEFLTEYCDTFKVAQHYFYNTSSDESEMKLCHQLMPVRMTIPDPITAATTGFNMMLDEPYKFYNHPGGTFNILGAFMYDYSKTKILLSPDVGTTTKLLIYYQYFISDGGNTVPIKIYYYDTGSSKSILDVSDEDWKEVNSISISPNMRPIEVNFEVPCNYFMIRVVANEGTASEVVWSSGVYDTTNLDLKNVELKNIDITEAKQFITFGNYIGAYDIADYNTAIFFSAPNDPGYFPFPDNTIDFLEEIYAVHKYLNMLLVVTSNALYLITPGNTIKDSSIKKILNNINVTKWDALDATVLNDQFCIKISDQYYIFKPNSYTSDATDIKHYLISAPIAKLLDVDGVKESTIIDILNEYLKTVIVKCSQSNIQGSTGSACVLNNVDYINILDKFSYTYKSDLHYVFTLNVKLKVSEFSKGEVYATNKNMFNLDKHNIYIDFSGDHPRVIVDESCLVDHSHISDTSYRVSYDWADNKLILKMHLIYDITNRTWRMYMEPTRNILVTEMNVSDYPDSVITYMNPRALIYNNTKDSYRSKFIDLHTGEYLESFNMQVAAESSTPLFGRFAITKLTYDSNTYNPELASVPDETQPYRFDIALSPDNILDEVVDIYTYLDTGNISLDDSFMKRFRELQLNLVNYELTKIPFHVNFKLDGQERIDDTNFRIQHITDVNDPDYGLIYITPVEVENLNLYSVTTFADDIEESDCWCLDLSKFPDNERVTLRFGLLGKGRRASVQILNDSLKKYEIADFNWVYRVMNGR